MKKEGKLQRRGRLLAGVLALCLVMMLGIFADGLSIVSHADSRGRVTATSARIRAEASTSSNTVGSVKRDATITIVGQVQGDDGRVWYEVWVDSATKGYIRSDLVQLIDGSTPVATPSPATPAPDTPVEVTPVNPVSATVTGGTSVRIRSNASTNSKILATVSNELALTVNGQANGADGYTWYQVTFISNGSQITGFIRSNFVTLSGEITPVAPEGPDDPQQPDETPVPEETPEPPQPTEEPQAKVYDTIFHNNEWKLYMPETNDSWSVATLLEGNVRTVNTQKTIIIVLVILLVAAVSAVGYLIFKLKDVMDSAYFNQVESETLRKRSAAAAQGGGQRVMHTVGAEKQSAGAQSQKPAGAQSQKPAGAQSQKPAGAQGQRPASQGQRPVSQGQSPMSQGQRPAGAQGQRPASQTQRPAGAQGQRPVSQGQRPAGAQGQRPAGQGQAAQNGASRPQPKDSQQVQGWQSKNFMTDDDDEFEFEFLNVDDNDKG